MVFYKTPCPFAVLFGPSSPTPLGWPTRGAFGPSSPTPLGWPTRGAFGLVTVSNYKYTWCYILGLQRHVTSTRTHYDKQESKQESSPYFPRLQENMTTYV
jgi:hypothetical protein